MASSAPAITAEAPHGQRALGSRIPAAHPQASQRPAPIVHVDTGKKVQWNGWPRCNGPWRQPVEVSWHRQGVPLVPLFEYQQSRRREELPRPAFPIVTVLLEDAHATHRREAAECVRYALSA